MLSGIGEDQHVKGVWDSVLTFVPVHGQRIGTACRAYMLTATDFGDPDILASSPALEHACNTVAVSITAVLVRLSMEWALVVQFLNQTAPQFPLDRVLEMSHCETAAIPLRSQQRLQIGHMDCCDKIPRNAAAGAAAAAAADAAAAAANVACAAIGLGLLPTADLAKLQLLKARNAAGFIQL
jgi:hypothetical protein